MSEDVAEITPIAKAPIDWSRTDRVGRRRLLRPLLPERQGTGAAGHHRAVPVRGGARRADRQARGAARTRMGGPSERRCSSPTGRLSRRSAGWRPISSCTSATWNGAPWARSAIPSLFTHENDTGPDGANHDRTGGVLHDGPSRPAHGRGRRPEPRRRGTQRPQDLSASTRPKGRSGGASCDASPGAEGVHRLVHRTVRLGQVDDRRDALPRAAGARDEDRDPGRRRRPARTCRRASASPRRTATRTSCGSRSSPTCSRATASATICCPISPYKETRDACRRMIGEFVEVFVYATVEEIAEHRDPKGLYKKALAGEINGLHRGRRPLRGARGPRARHRHRWPRSPRQSMQHVLDVLADARLHRGRDGSRRGRPRPLGPDGSAHHRHGARGEGSVSLSPRPFAVPGTFGGCRRPSARPFPGGRSAFPGPAS